MIKISLIMLLTLMGCGEKIQNTGAPESPEMKRKFGFGSIISEDGISIGSQGIRGKNKDGIGQANRYLWLGSLKTLESVSLQSSDAVGGVIISDWHTVSGHPNIQMKVTVQITSQYLETKALHVIVHKRQLKSAHQWIELGVDPKLTEKIENTILTTARDLYIKDKQN
jgi:hypothetical protein